MTAGAKLAESELDCELMRGIEGANKRQAPDIALMDAEAAAADNSTVGISRRGAEIPLIAGQERNYPERKMSGAVGNVTIVKAAC